MISPRESILSSKKRYLQIALNSTLEEARSIIFQLPKSDRILIEAGTPFIKQYGAYGIQQISQWATMHFSGQPQNVYGLNSSLASTLIQNMRKKKENSAVAPAPYIVADMKTMDRGETEVATAA